MTDGLRGVLGLAVVLGVGIGCGHAMKPDCVTPPCAMPMAIVARVSSADGGPVPGVTLTISGAAVGAGQCTTDAGTTTCYVPGMPGRYDLLFGAPRFEAKSLSVTVQGSTPSCGCTSVEEQDVIVALTPS